MKKYLILFFLSFFVYQKIIAQWETNGPFGGDIRCFASNDTNIFVGTGAGVFFSNNYGVSWEKVNNGLPPNSDVYSLAISGTTVYAGTWYEGIFVSTNNGNNWTSIGLTNTAIPSLAVNGTNIFAGTNGQGVFFSNNNGNTWTTINNGMPSTYVTSFLINGGKIFAGTLQGIYFSVDNGNTWNATSITNMIWELAITEGNIFAGGGSVFLSTDNGGSWNTVNNGLNTSVSSLTVNGGNIFAGTSAGVFISNDNGSNWSQVNNGLPSLNTTALSSCGSNIFVGTFARGIFLSSNNGSNWTEANNGMTNSTVWALTSSGGNVFAGIRSRGIFLSTDNGNSWNEVNNGFVSSEILSLASLGNKVFAGGNGLYFSENNGNNWTQITNGLPNASFRTLTVDNGSIYAGTSNGLYFSLDTGNNWSAIDNGSNLLNNDIGDISVEGSTIIVIGQWVGGVFISTDHGNSWIQSYNGINSSDFTSVEIINGKFFTGTDQELYKSINNGGNWFSVNNGLPYNSYISSFAVSGESIFVGSNANGVFFSTDDGINWAEVNEGLASTLITELEISGEYLFAGTTYGGVWKRQLSEINNIIEVNRDNTFLVYPNPNNGNFTLTISDSEISNSDLIIYNVLGKIIHFQKIQTPDSELKLNIPNGIYFVQIKSGENVYQQKIVKM